MRERCIQARSQAIVRWRKQFLRQASFVPIPLQIGPCSTLTIAEKSKKAQPEIVCDRRMQASQNSRPVVSEPRNALLEYSSEARVRPNCLGRLFPPSSRQREQAAARQTQTRKSAPAMGPGTGTPSGSSSVRSSVDCCSISNGNCFRVTGEQSKSFCEPSLQNCFVLNKLYEWNS
jgi:hypothetical protein